MLIYQKPSWRDFQNLEMYVVLQATSYPGAQKGAGRPHTRTARSACGIRLACSPCPACGIRLACSPCPACGTRLACSPCSACGPCPACGPCLACSPCSALGPHSARGRCSACGPNSARSRCFARDSRPVAPPLCSRPALSARCHPVSQAGPRAPFSSIRPAWSRRFLHGCAQCFRSRKGTERWRLCCGPGR